jgi:cysteinyl-tRNA synthetase
LPNAYAVVREIVRSDLAVEERRWLVLDADFVLGLDLDRSERAGGDSDVPVPPEVTTLAAERQRARAARDFATADELRARISDAGFDVIDGPDGQTLRRH